MSAPHSVARDNVQGRIAAYLLTLSESPHVPEIERFAAAAMFKELPDWQTNAARELIARGAK